MPRINFLETKPSGTCKVCGINCWKETGNKPAVWPCGIETCPYPRGEVIPFPQSSVGSSLALLS